MNVLTPQQRSTVVTLLRLLDLNAAALEARVEVPPMAVNHLHPRVHAEWNRELFERIRTSRES